MLQLTTLLRHLGSEGAVANVRAVLEDRRREDWVVEGLARRLEHLDREPALPAASTAAGTAAAA